MMYYALYGINAIAVFNDYSKLEDSRKYVKKSQCMSFSTMKEAKSYAEFQHNMLNDGKSPDDFYFPDNIKLNWVYFRPKWM